MRRRTLAAALGHGGAWGPGDDYDYTTIATTGGAADDALDDAAADKAVLTPWRHAATTAGGVAPISHPSPLRTIVDIDLANFDEVWAAGGHPHYVFPTSSTSWSASPAAPPADVGA